MDQRVGWCVCNKVWFNVLARFFPFGSYRINILQVHCKRKKAWVKKKFKNVWLINYYVMLANYIASLHGSESSYMVDDNKDIIGILLPHDMLANYRAS